MAALKVLFGNMVHGYAREEGRTLEEIAAKVKMPSSQFTRWKNGKWTVIETTKLVQIVRATTDDFHKQASLIIAYLVDMTPVEFRTMIDVGLRGEVKNGNNTASELTGPWSLDVRRKIEAIGKAYAKDEDFQRMVDQLASWGRRILKEE